MIYQNDSKNENIRKWGCFFLSLGRAVEQLTPIKIDMECVDEVYAEAVRRGIILEDCTVVKHALLIKLWGKYCGYDINAYYCYKLKSRVKEVFNSNKEPNFFITHFSHGADGHFVHTDEKSKVLFDTWKGGSVSAKEGKVSSLRAFYISL